MIKRFLSIILIGLLSLSVISCNVNKHSGTIQKEVPSGLAIVPEKNATLTVWESPGAESRYLEMVARAFETQYGIKVTIKAVSAVDSGSKMLTDGPSGKGADVFAAPHDHLGEMVAAQLIVPISAQERVHNEFMQVAVDGLSYNGQLYGYPMGIETYALFYNKSVFKTAPETYDAIFEKAKTFNSKPKQQWVMLWDVGNAYYAHSFIAANGGYIFGSGGTDSSDLGIDKPEAIAGAKTYLNFRQIIDLKVADINTDKMETLFDMGKVGAMIDGPWAVDGRKAKGIDFGVAKLPKLAGDIQQPSFSGIRALYVSRYSNFPKAAQCFANLATSKEMLRLRFSTTSQIPPMLALMDDPTIKKDPYAAAFLEQSQYAMPMPSIPEMALVWSPYCVAFQKMWDGALEPDHALKEAADQIRSKIDQSK